MKKTRIKLKNGQKTKASTPIIISASRATDIPSYYSDWLINSLKRGYVARLNPFNRKKYYISFQNARLIVFWTKNPEPMISKLKKINEMNYNYYFQFTLNDYPNKLEPNIPSLQKRIKTFKNLSNIIGKEKIIWRFDPLILTEDIDIDNLVSRIENVGSQIKNYTEKLVISFADIKVYKKVQNNLKRNNINYKIFNKEKMKEIAGKIAELINKWDMKVATCAESIDLSEYNISHNKCIDDNLIEKLYPNDEKLMKFLYGRNYNKWIKSRSKLNFDTNDISKKKLKDPGQREACGCIKSKDIGMYNTCKNLCTYCYANYSKKVVNKNYRKHDLKGESIIDIESKN